jgi:hypothetical protein
LKNWSVALDCGDRAFSPSPGTPGEGTRKGMSQQLEIIPKNCLVNKNQKAHEVTREVTAWAVVAFPPCTGTVPQPTGHFRGIRMRRSLAVAFR